MNLKEAIIYGIKMGMETFSIRHFKYRGRCFEQNLETILEFIQGYEDCIPVTCYYGSWDSDRPTHCHISYKLKEESL